MIVVKADKPVFGAAPLIRDGEWISYDTHDHKRHAVTHDTVITLDNEEVHHAKRTEDIT